ncbi:tryptophan 2,3-dioxygenase [Streptomonospora litoralis]|uniref:Tryptophan 2,3-dioxygenase n=1 Tax=Streptomonospora litoralis TaxID=2498135 RepID=A0A4P6Q4H4_9ACTN|nr:tryptophan 2,3-dioxygenase family protein [Streptomonospora litoralis]QBI55160.1 Tryptophan 2,3-dioxygenase [Streptomonospora litoralis]
MATTAPYEHGRSAARDGAAEHDGGPAACPVLGADEAAAYTDYVHTETLLSLQRPRTGEPAELSFIITTQVMELLFTLIRSHWEHARDALEADAPAAAVAALRRGTGAQDVLAESWGLLATLTPAEFDRFRDALGVASGVQSAAYRRLEFLIGNKSAGMARAHRDQPAARTALEQTLAEPGLYDAALRLLHRRGLPVPASAVERDWRRPYTPDAGVRRAWGEVYADERPGNELLQLAEALMDTAERVTRWRHRHLMAVKRAMGAKPGTGGSSGLDWLARNAEQDVFPELWWLRTGV